MMTQSTCTATKKGRGRRRWPARALSVALAAVLLVMSSPPALADACPLTVNWLNHRIDGDTVVVTAEVHDYTEGEPIATDAQVVEYHACLVAYERVQISDSDYKRGDEVARVPMTTSTASIALSGPGYYEVVLECGGWEADGYGTWDSPYPWYGKYELEPKDWENGSWTEDGEDWTEGDARERFLELITDLGSLSGQKLLDAVIQEYNETPEGSRLMELAYDIVWALQDAGELEELKALEGGRYAPLLDYTQGWGELALPQEDMARTLVGTQTMNVSAIEQELARQKLDDLSGEALARAVAAEDAKYITLLPGDALAVSIAYAQDELTYYGSDFMAYLRRLDGGRYAPLLDYLASKIRAELDILEGAGEVAEFPDVTGDEWFAEYAYYAKDSGLFTGMSDGRFAPRGQLTIAQALTLAARLYSSQTEIPVPRGTGSWYQPYVDYLRAEGLPWKYADYSAAIDRYEFAHIFTSVVNSIDRAWAGNYLRDVLTLRNQVPDGAIPDLPMSAPYASEIYQLYRLGILTGSNPAHSFRGSSNITRAEVSAILCRMLGIDLQEISMA